MKILHQIHFDDTDNDVSLPVSQIEFLGSFAEMSNKWAQTFESKHQSISWVTSIDGVFARSKLIAWANPNVTELTAAFMSHLCNVSPSLSFSLHRMITS